MKPLTQHASDQEMHHLLSFIGMSVSGMLGADKSELILVDSKKEIGGVVDEFDDKGEDKDRILIYKKTSCSAKILQLVFRLFIDLRMFKRFYEILLF